MQPLGRLALLAIGLTILNDRALAQDWLGAIEIPAGDVHHRHLEMDERKILIEVDRARQRLQPLLAPRRVRQAELIADSGRTMTTKSSICPQRVHTRWAVTAAHGVPIAVAA